MLLWGESKGEEKKGFQLRVSVEAGRDFSMNGDKEGERDQGEGERKEPTPMRKTRA